MMTSGEQLEQAVAAFVQAARLLDAPRLHVWDERGLTLPQLRILFHLRRRPGSGVREIAQTFEVTAGNITQQVDKLVNRGLVSRADRPEDRRQVSLRLTEDGEQIVSEVSQTARGYIRGTLEQFPESDLAELTRLLNHVIDVAAARPIAAVEQLTASQAGDA